LTSEHKDDHDYNLVDNLWKDISPHDWLNQFFFSANSLEFRVFLSLNEWFSADGGSSKDIHDKVHPQKLNNTEWWLTDGTSGNEYCAQQTDVHCELKLHEFSYILINGSSPHD